MYVHSYLPNTCINKWSSLVLYKILNNCIVNINIIMNCISEKYLAKSLATYINIYICYEEFKKIMVSIL